MTHPCGDPSCNKDREAKMVVVKEGAPDPDQPGRIKGAVWCDPCIAPLVKALNDAGLATTWSCCGHGHLPACIGLASGQELVIARNADELKFITAIFPKDINGNPAPSAYDLHGWFGLSYASWLTLPRVLMQAMPEEWQRQMALLLNQYDEAYPNQPDYGTRVQIEKSGKLVKSPDWLLDYRHPDRGEIDACRPKPSEAAE